MSPSHSRHSPTALSDDDIVNVFLRSPPEHPARLVRASLVCKDWRRILTGPEFCRLYREFHRTPPMIGLFVSSWGPYDMGVISRFIPTTSIRLSVSAGFDYYPLNWRFVDSRHGRILVGIVDDYVHHRGYIVWDPITNRRWGVPPPAIDPVSWTAAVLCAKENCDHQGCHGQPFLIAMVFYSVEIMSACVYSSESGVWSDIINLDYCAEFEWSGGSALVGNTLHFPFVAGGNVLQYKFREQKLSVIELPNKNWDEDDVPSVFISAEDDVLVFAGMDYRRARLSLWSTKAGAVAWTKRSVIDLKKLLPPRAFEPIPRAPQPEYHLPEICGFAQGLLFLTTMAGLFTVELSSC
ncbi:unnamed protein product [Alopecurus aequalis]